MLYDFVPKFVPPHTGPKFTATSTTSSRVTLISVPGPVITLKSAADARQPRANELYRNRKTSRRNESLLISNTRETFYQYVFIGSNGKRARARHTGELLIYALEFGGCRTKRQTGARSVIKLISIVWLCGVSRGVAVGFRGKFGWEALDCKL